VKRLLYALNKHGDRAVIHGLKGKPSNRRIDKTMEKEAVRILSADVYQGFGPTLAAEYLRDKHHIEASKETVRQWMIRGELWRPKKEKVKEFHCWRQRRSRFGELVLTMSEDVRPTLSPDKVCHTSSPLARIPAITTGWKGAEKICT